MVWAETTPAAVHKSTFPMFIGRPLLTDQKGPNHAFIVTAHLTIQARNTTPCAAVTFNRNGRSRSPEYANEAMSKKFGEMVEQFGASA